MIPPLKYEIDIKSERIAQPVQLDPAVADLEIYEHIDFPFLTAKIAITDEQDFYERFDIIGGEKVDIKLKSFKDEKPFSGASSPNIQEIEKKFVVAEVLKTHRGEDDRTQVIVLHLVEDIGFNSNLQNINKVYKGKISDIIKKLVSNFLGKELDTEGKDTQNLKVIIPNLSPLDACSWLTNRATTSEGYPFFFYSTLLDEKLQFNDLGTLLFENASINPSDDRGNAPTFKYSKSIAESTDHLLASAAIYEYNHDNAENIYKLISDGLVGSRQQLINSSAVVVKPEIEFNLNTTLLPFQAKLPPTQNILLYSNFLEGSGKPFADHKSRTISQFGGSNSHRITKSSQFDRSYSETIDTADHMNTVKARAYHEYMNKAPLTFVVPGNDFLDGNHNTTLGRKINLQFLSTETVNVVDETPDSKFSGEYLIISARHIIKKERYDIRFTGARFANQSVQESKNSSAEQFPAAKEKQASHKAPPTFDIDTKGGPF